jgi:septal ring factor EnvC (AmiA/AmiB activator)
MFEAFPISFHIKNSHTDNEFIKFKCFYEGIRNDIKEVRNNIAIERKKRAEAKKKKRNERGGKKYDSEDESEEEDDEEEDEDDRIPNNIWIIKPGEYSNQGHGI